MKASVAMTEAMLSVLLSVPTPITANTVSTIPAVEVSHEANIAKVPELASAERDVDQGFVVTLVLSRASLVLS